MEILAGLSVIVGFYVVVIGILLMQNEEDS